MENRQRITLKIFEGANLFAPFAAVVAEFTSPHGGTLASSAARRALADLLPPSLDLHVNLEDETVDFVHLVARLTSAWQDLRGPNGLPVQIDQLSARECRIILGFHDPEVATAALQLAMNLAEAIFRRSSGGLADRSIFLPAMKRMVNLVRIRQPDYIARTLIRVARQRGIPVYGAAPGSQMWVYGQGVYGHLLHETAGKRNSIAGARLAANKVASNRLIQRLGFPGVMHKIAANLGAAMQIAHEIGYPVVVKPARGSHGKGVSVDLRNSEEVRIGFEKALPHAQDQILIEKFVAGDDYRLSVFGGKLMRASRLTPPHVVGDGVHSIADLIDAENSRRGDNAAKIVDSLVKLDVDPEVIDALQKQGFALTDRPLRDVKLFLRRTANLKAGGKLEDVTALTHPDNIVMAEAIARTFRLDSAGIDFITPDITKSWQAVECAVVEVNATPGIGDYLAEKILLDKFPTNSDGRIPSVLIVGGESTLAERIADAIETNGKCVGVTDSEMTRLGSHRRFSRRTPLASRIMSLLLDPACEALVVACTVGEIADYGMPHTRYDVALLGESVALDEEICRLIASNSSHLVENVRETTLGDIALPLIVTAINPR